MWSQYAEAAACLATLSLHTDSLRIANWQTFGAWPIARRFEAVSDANMSDLLDADIPLMWLEASYKERDTSSCWCRLDLDVDLVAFAEGVE
jgi:hypothetical protein